MPKMLRILAVVLVAIAVAWPPAEATAHDLVDEGRTAYEEAEFVEAVEAFARAEAADDLAVDDLTEMYAVRALVHHAMGNQDAMRADLARLATVAPDFELDRRVLPEVRRAFAEARAEVGPPLRMSLQPEGDVAGVTISARVENDDVGLVREVRIYGRPAGGDYAQATDAPLTLEADGSAMVEYFAEAVGPGGAVLLSRGAEDEPLRYRVGARADEDSEEEGGSALPWILGGLGVLVVGAAVVLVLFLTGTFDGGGNTEVDPFVVRF